MSYSNTERRILHAKRRNERPNGLAAPTMQWREPNDEEDIEIKRGIKRQLGSPTKNIANDRLKRLRTKLNQEVAAAQPRRSFHQLAVQLQAAKRRRSAAPIKRSSSSLRRSRCSAMYAAMWDNPVDEVRIQIEGNDQGNRSEIEWDKCSNELVPVQPSVNNGRLYIVVDTNIFMSNLNLIKDIVDDNGPNRPIIYIPWMVNEELDYLKEDKIKGNARYQAQTAIKYINHALVNEKGRILGQTLDEYNEQKPCDKNPDNKILMCCLQLRDNQKNIVLLSNDFNIRNKAMIHGIRAFSHDQGAGFLIIRGSKAEKILDSFTELCSKVIACCAREAYGSNWYKLHLLGSKPQSTADCIRIFKKYWFTVFREHLMKQFNKAVDHLSSFLLANETRLKDNSLQLSDLVSHCVRVCVYLKDVREQKNAVEETIRTLNEIKASH